MSKTPEGRILYQLTFSNYLRCFEWVYLNVIGKTLFLSLTATFFSLLIGFPVAYYLARCSPKAQQLGLILLFIPFWTNFILRIYGIVTLLGSNGLINKLLMQIGIINEPLSFLYTRTGVYIGLIYNYLPFLIIPIFSALEKLDPSLRDAAQDLGANRFQIFWRITVPCIRSAILTGILFVFIPILGEFVIPDLLGGAKESFLGNVMVNQFFIMQDWPFGSTFAGMLSFLLLGCMILHKNKKHGLIPNHLESI